LHDDLLVGTYMRLAFIIVGHSSLLGYELRPKKQVTIYTYRLLRDKYKKCNISPFTKSRRNMISRYLREKHKKNTVSRLVRDWPKKQLII